MTLRELFTGWDARWAAFHETITTANLLDWPLSYVFICGVAAVTAYCVLILLCGMATGLLDRLRG